MSVSMLSSLTHHPKALYCSICGVIPVAHEAKMLYCITDTVRRTSF